MKLVSVILARGGSKGLPKKNIKKLKGKPLIYYSIEQSSLSKVKETWVCTDSEEIAKISKKFGAKVLMRPPALATDKSKSEEALLYFSKHVDFDVLVFIQPTSPLIKSKYINAGLDLILDKKYDSVFSAYSEHWVPRWKKNSIKEFNWNKNKRPMRQEKEELWVENGAFYITKKSFLEKSKLRYSGRLGVVEMPQHLSYQVDTIEDFKIIGKFI